MTVSIILKNWRKVWERRKLRRKKIMLGEEEAGKSALLLQVTVMRREGKSKGTACSAFCFSAALV